MALKFPEGFRWGTATASFQIEGATREDGRGESIWDRFASIPGNILTGETGDPACDSYHRYEEDIELMRALGVNAYRFSIAWPRIVPDGDGAVNQRGLDYYSRLVDGLLAAGITPFITLYHWDLPQALQDKGGWGNRATIDAFVRYVDVVVSHLGDRVVHWMTHNEPWCISILSHYLGAHAPGLRDRKLALQVAHNLLVSHGLAVPVIRNRCPQAEVGIVLNFNPAYPVTESEADKAMTRLYHAQFNLWFLDPISGRGYPQDAWQAYGDDVPEIQPGDMEIMTAPLDFLGVNYYSWHLCHDRTQTDLQKYPIVRRPNPVHQMARGWQNVPHALKDLLTWLHTDYSFPALYVTENGATYDDEVWEGRIHDSARQKYLRDHLAVLPPLIESGINLKGYFYWSLLDNFEWAAGTRDRFGLVYTDFATQQRIIKDSGLWYSRVTRANALVD